MSKLNIFLLDNLSNTKEEIIINKPKTYQELLNQLGQRFKNMLFELFIFDNFNNKIIINKEEKYAKIKDILFMQEIAKDDLEKSIFAINYDKLAESKQEILDEKYNCILCSVIIKNESPYLCYKCQNIFHEKCLKDWDKKCKMQNKHLTCPNCRNELSLENWNKKLDYEDNRNAIANLLNKINNNNRNEQLKLLKKYEKFFEEIMTIFKNILNKIFSIHNSLKMKNINKLKELINNYPLNFDNFNINNISNIIYEELDTINKNINKQNNNENNKDNNEDNNFNLLNNSNFNIINNDKEANKKDEILFDKFKELKIDNRDEIRQNLNESQLIQIIKEKDKDIFKDENIINDPIKCISALIDLKKEINKICSTSEMKVIEENAFNILMNEFYFEKRLDNLADYIDYCMKIGFKGKTEKEIDNYLKDIIFFFKLLNYKFVFINLLEIKTRERLLEDLSISLYTEKIFLFKLRDASGLKIKPILEMISNIEESFKENKQYKKTQNKGDPNGIKFNVTVISNIWKLKKIYFEKIIIPNFLRFCIYDFEKYYLNKYKNKKLIWSLNLSRLEIQYLYLKNKNISISTLPQLLTLLLLEKYNKLSIQQISEFLGYDLKLLKKDIIGLIFNPNFNPNDEINKGIILADVDPVKQELQEDTEITINKIFSIAQQRFSTLPKKGMVRFLEEEEEEKKIIKRREDMIIQATLTRIMKSRIGQKTTIKMLFNEAAKKITLFKVEPHQIEENIEKLIEKNCIKMVQNYYEYIP